MNPLTFIFKNSSFDAMLVQLNVINMADTERFVCVISVDSVTTPWFNFLNLGLNKKIEIFISDLYYSG